MTTIVVNGDQVVNSVSDFTRLCGIGLVVLAIIGIAEQVYVFVGQADTGGGWGTSLYFGIAYSIGVLFAGIFAIMAGNTKEWQWAQRMLITLILCFVLYCISFLIQVLFIAIVDTAANLCVGTQVDNGGSNTNGAENADNSVCAAALAIALPIVWVTVVLSFICGCACCLACIHQARRQIAVTRNLAPGGGGVVVVQQQYVQQSQPPMGTPMSMAGDANKQPNEAAYIQSV